MENKTLTNNLLCLSADNNKLLVLPDAIQTEVSVAMLIDLFSHSDYKQFKLNHSALTEVVQCVVRLKKQPESAKDVRSIVIAERINAQLTIHIDPLSMLAKATIISAYGGLPMTTLQLSTKINELHIKHGILKKNIMLLLEKSKLAQPGQSFQATIAKGIEAIHGTDSLFERLVEIPKERLLRPKKNKDGSVDMRDLGQLITVKPDSKLMRKIPSIQGKDGMTISGDIINHRIGQNLTLEVGKNTHLCPDDKNLLLSTSSGIPKVLHNGMMVDDVLIIHNVDVGYGHVNFAGSVIIEGNVCDGMKVTASGDINISGFVESAQLECGGDLIVGKGIIGHKIEEGSHDYSCEANVKGSISAHFSQYSKIIAGTEVNISKQLLHCHVTCQGDINVLDESGYKGNILGGSLHTMGSVNTVSLGASAGAKTVIDLIGNYPVLMQHKKSLNHAIHDAQNKLQDLIDAQYKVNSMADSEKKQTLYGRLIITKMQAKKQLSSLKIELSENSHEIERYFKQAKVITKKEVFNDVFITIGKEKFRSNRDYGPTKVSIKNNRIVALPY